MIATSDTKPETIEIDVVREGRARLLVHWDIQEIERTDDGTPRTVYEYSECVIWWTLPKKFANLAAIRTYLDGVGPEIIDWAQAAEIDMVGPPLNVAPTPEEAAERAMSPPLPRSRPVRPAVRGAPDGLYGRTHPRRRDDDGSEQDRIPGAVGGLQRRGWRSRMKCSRCGREVHAGPCTFTAGKSVAEKLRDDMTSVKGRLTSVEKAEKA